MWDQPVLYYSLLELHAGSAHAHKQPAGAGHEPEPVCEWGAVQLAFRRPTNIRSIGFPCGSGLCRSGITLAAAGHGHCQIGAPVNSRRLVLNVCATTLKGSVLSLLRHEQLNAQTIIGGTDMQGRSTAADSPQLNPNLGRHHINLNSIQPRRFLPEQQTSGLAGFLTVCCRTTDLSPH